MSAAVDTAQPAAAAGSTQPPKLADDQRAVIVSLLQAQVRAIFSALVARERARRPSSVQPAGPRPPTQGSRTSSRQRRRKPLRDLMKPGGLDGVAEEPASPPRGAAPPPAPVRLPTIPIASCADIPWRCPALGVLGIRSGASWVPCDAVRDHIAVTRQHWIAQIGALPSPGGTSARRTGPEGAEGGDVTGTQPSPRVAARQLSAVRYPAPSTSRSRRATEQGQGTTPSGSKSAREDIDWKGAGSPSDKKQKKPEARRRNPFYKAYMQNLVVLLGTYDTSQKKITASPGGTQLESKEEPTPIPHALEPPEETDPRRHGASQRLYSPPPPDAREERGRWEERLKRLTMTTESAQEELARKRAMVQTVNALFRGKMVHGDTPPPSDDEGGLL